ncbi:ABC transporter permease [Sphaerisporangium sp. NPDC051011]|uniref:ABC transporter permease n=1 Tax=Sphaerisporangium sp. NPDC051011 TaxID=3155792 RepID=UPI0033D727BB
MSAASTTAAAGFRLRAIPGLAGPAPVIVSVTILAVVVIAAVIAPLITTFTPDQVDLAATLRPPGTAGHLLGTDSTGRDIFSRVVFGARVSLVPPLLVTALASAIGITLGVVCGWFGGMVDAGLSRVVDFLFAFPGLLVAMLAVALFGRGLTAPTVGLIVAFAPYVARLARNLVIQEKSRPYVEAYRQQGFGNHTIAFAKVLPNIAPTLLAQCALGFGYALVDLAALSYLGLGVQPPTADWGVMVAEGQDALVQGVAFPVLFPCIAVLLVVVAVNIVGDHLGDKLSGRVAA